MCDFKRWLNYIPINIWKTLRYWENCIESLFPLIDKPAKIDD